MTAIHPPKWDHQEFLAYFLLFAAHADIQYNDDEQQHILSKIHPNTYEKVWSEFSSDNDYTQIQKIIQYYQINPELSLACTYGRTQSIIFGRQSFSPNGKGHAK